MTGVGWLILACDCARSGRASREDCCAASERALGQEEPASKTNRDGRCDKKRERNLAHKRQRRKADRETKTLYATANRNGERVQSIVRLAASLLRAAIFHEDMF